MDLGDRCDMARVFRRRVRRRSTWVWLVMVVLLGVLGLPWVQVAIGHWGFRNGFYSLGNINALYDDRADIDVHEAEYIGLIDPPIRWGDLERIALGDPDAIEHFRVSVLQVAESSRGYRNAYMTYRFAIGTPRYYFNPEHGGAWKFPDDDYPSTFINRSYRFSGWPSYWVNEETEHWYWMDPVRIDEPELLDIDDLVHLEKVERRVYWDNILFAMSVVGFLGYVGFRVCVWRRVQWKRGMCIGALIAIALGLVVFTVGRKQKDFAGHGVLAQMNPVVQSTQKPLGLEELKAVVSTDAGVRDLAASLVDEFGEMESPSDLVAIEMSSDVGEGAYMLSFGYGYFRLIGLNVLESARLEKDGSYTEVPVFNEQSGSRSGSKSWVRNGIASLIWGWGKPVAKVYGVLVEYQNLFFVGIGLYVFRFVVRLIGWGVFRLIQRRRMRKGVCAWCTYPCDL